MANIDQPTYSRRSERVGTQIDYKQLNNGPDLPKEQKEIKTWSTTKLYPLVIVDSKDIDGKLFVKVHYTDEEWNSTVYDTWREASEIVDVPEFYLTYTPELKALFVDQLKTSIKENLHGQRKVDSAVKIDLSIPKNLFEDIATLGCEIRGSCLTLQSTADFNCLLGEDWHWRVFNSMGDFAFVTPGTVTFWMKERRPLEEYSPEGVLILKHRGFRFHFRFARGIGNKFDFQNFF